MCSICVEYSLRNKAVSVPCVACFINGDNFAKESLFAHTGQRNVQGAPAGNLPSVANVRSFFRLCRSGMLHLLQGFL